MIGWIGHTRGLSAAARACLLAGTVSGTGRPADAFTAVKYRDHWCWVDDRDFRSKGIFTLLMVVMTLAEKEEKVQPPVVTIPAN